MAKLPVLQSKRLTITTFEKLFLTDNYIGWLNDKEVVKFSEQRHRQHDRQSCEKFMHSFDNSPNYFSAICTQKEHIGNTSITIDTDNQIADVAIMIGNRNFWGQGYGKEAFKTVVDHLLTYDTIRKVTAGTMAENKAMLKSFAYAEMHEECRRKGHFLLDGKPVDLIYACKWK